MARRIDPKTQAMMQRYARMSPDDVRRERERREARKRLRPETAIFDAFHPDPDLYERALDGMIAEQERKEQPTLGQNAMACTRGGVIRGRFVGRLPRTDAVVIDTEHGRVVLLPNAVTRLLRVS